jgi:hypothetical protein
MTLEIDQCKTMEDDMKEEYGEDFLTNREKFPLTSQTLTLLAGTTCKDYFGYSDLVNEYCSEIKNFPEQIGGGQTCADRVDNSVRSEWCLLDKERVKTDSKCNKEQLGTAYESMASKFCKKNPTDKWCSCYNLKNKVCFEDSTAIGCKYYKQLDDNKTYFKDGYSILRENAHCRPNACKDGYVPENVTSDCKNSYEFCGKDMNIRSMTNNDIIVECNGSKPLELPEWWDSEFDESFFDEDREPPFDKPPFNALPITRWPKRFRWKDKNVRYVTYGSVVCIILCIIILRIIFKKKPINDFYKK